MEKQPAKVQHFKLPLIEQRLHVLNKLSKSNTKRNQLDNIYSPINIKSK